MADRRGMRPSSRRTTPTPQPASKPNPPPASRITRRSTRSASREITDYPELVKPTRRSARQASIASDISEGNVAGPLRQATKRHAQKDSLGDLTVVEEVDTTIAVMDAPGTPPRSDVPVPNSLRSPGAISEMSGTTAISSMSIVEAELLESKLVIRHFSKLYSETKDFLDLLVPKTGRPEDDKTHIREAQMPDSEFNGDFRDFEDDVKHRMKHYRSEHQVYISVRAIHRSLFGPNRDVAAAQCGLDLVLYLANLLVLAKEMIHSSKTSSSTWGTLRELDNLFPTHFIPNFVDGKDERVLAGDSALLDKTFDLALELRTQLAILVLERSSNEKTFDPEEELEGVFLHSELSQEASNVRGWATSALGGDEKLPQRLSDRVAQRVAELKALVPADAQSREPGERIDLDGLNVMFPWEETLLLLLDWARQRYIELDEAIQKQGGISSILEKIKTEMQRPVEDQDATLVSRASPRKKRTSFKRSKRRSSRKFDPDAGVDDEVIDLLFGPQSVAAEQPAEHAQPVQQYAPEPNQDEPTEHAQPVQQSVPEPNNDEPTEQEDERFIDLPLDEDEIFPPIQPDGGPEVSEDVEHPEARERPDGPDREKESERGPPLSSAAMVALLNKTAKTGKENRPKPKVTNEQEVRQTVSFQVTDNQATPGPSSFKKGKQRQESTPGTKRRRSADDDDDEEAFEPANRTAGVHQRRSIAPVAKRPRLESSSQKVPTSHQPPRTQDPGTQEPGTQGGTELPPPRFQDMKQLSRYGGDRARAPSGAQRGPIRQPRQRRGRCTWTAEEEDALIQYMEMFPQSYSRILEYDKCEGYQLLQDKDQVQLKDKARNMAITMIRAGVGFKPGFEKLILKDTVHGRKLEEDGYDLDMIVLPP
ncbi:hypothetical protein BS50DRAFT_494425 [Corynespora cassiicola Philippines]|uniref:Myb-like domain-containing protein n=1 Tax=Corynespora cassiicola Philippines TaxID=1448308 RepID=A0A2T2NMU4_CORCC|nr:hypothetical protein BS50DRAFT_494425 [Corynespora cassiicola Philippines]